MSAHYFISLLCRFAPTPLLYIISIHTRYRRCAPLPLRGNSATRLPLCAVRCAHSAGASRPALSTLHLCIGYIPLICQLLLCGLSDTLL